MSIDFNFKKILLGNNVSHAHNKERRKFKSNLQKKKIFIPGLNDFITVKCPVSMVKSLVKNTNIIKNLTNTYGKEGKRK